MWAPPRNLYGILEIMSNWTTPCDLPDLSQAKIIGLDTETFDPNLKTKGPGAVRKDGHLVGISVAVDERNAWYLPMRHEYDAQDNLDPEAVLRWARDNLTRPNQLKVGANLLYDLEFLACEGVNVAGPFWDVQVADPLINENLFSYSLDAIAKRRIGLNKVDDELYNWSHQTYGGKPGRDQAANIYRCPPKLVGPYAEADAWLPYKIMLEQQKLLGQQELNYIADLEMRLIPILLAMRLNGVRVNAEGAAELNDKLESKEIELQLELDRLAGFHVYTTNKQQTIDKLFDKLDLEYPKTPKTKKGSFTKGFLENHSHHAAELISAIRKIAKIRGTFLENAISGHQVNGRIYTQFHQMKSDANGTVSGRFSSSNPNLQQIPSRDEETAPLVRGLFIPEDGCSWRRYDWSQIEYRLLVHYAVGDSGDIARSMYKSDPKTDFHKFTQDLVLTMTGKDLGRKPTKNINFGLCIAKDQLVLTNAGLVPIQDVTLKHRLWDGIEWVMHDGVIYKGKKEVMTYDGLTATPEHKIWTDTGWKISIRQAASESCKLARTGRGTAPIRFGYACIGSEINTPQREVYCDRRALRSVQSNKELQYQQSAIGNKKREPEKQTASVYDILNAGPRRRFTCSNVLVSNCYGMGIPKLATQLGMPKEYVQDLFEHYHTAVPFVKETFNKAASLAGRRGWVKTILGRRAHFDWWEYGKFLWYDEQAKIIKDNGYPEDWFKPVPDRQQAIEKWGMVKRAYTHKALNRVLQGGSADGMKKAMVEIWEAGLCDVVGPPLLTVHDELDFNDPKTAASEAAFAEIKRIMENCLPQVKVPMLADEEVGPDWGHLKEISK